jgi:hypothetical protein
VLTLVGVFSGGLGFLAQFVGLRGLPWPCSISQLVAIFAMALVRALIRRRLGKIPLSCRALSNYELDFLATRIVFNDDFREFDFAREGNKYLKDVEPKDRCLWKVATPHPNVLDKFSLPRSVNPAQTNNPTRDSDVSSEYIEPVDGIMTAQSNMLVSEKAVVSTTTTVKDASDGGGPEQETKRPKLPLRFCRRRPSNKVEADETTGFREGSSQQLVRVRGRLGNLCQWSNSASAAALTLAQSIEQFMTTFFQLGETDPIKWVVEASKLSHDKRHVDTDSVVISLSPVTAGSKTRYLVEIGKIEAVLSLWIASMEAEMIKSTEQATHQSGAPGKGPPQDELADWRRSKAGIGSKLDYCRIIGDNYEDGVLKRDISWWVGRQIADQAHVETDDSETDGAATTPARGGEKVKIVIGFNGPQEGEETTSCSRVGVVELIR